MGRPILFSFCRTTEPGKGYDKAGDKKCGRNGVDLLPACVRGSTSAGGKDHANIHCTGAAFAWRNILSLERTERVMKYDSYKMSTIVELMNAHNTFTEARDFGTGEKYHTVEIHIMSYIADNPGITVTELACDWNRTKGAISQIIKKLETKDLIFRQKDRGNNKNVYLYVTEKGKILDEAHKKYDNKNYKDFLNELQKHYSEKKIQELFEMLETWITLLIKEKSK